MSRFELVGDPRVEGHVSPFISIIMPVYGVESVLEAAMASLRGQTFQEWVVYGVDDGSRDNCGAMLDEAARQDDRFCIIHQRNAGLSQARNRALPRIKSAYFCFFDSDDLLHPQALESMAAFTRRYTADLITFQPEPFLSEPTHFPPLDVPQLPHCYTERKPPNEPGIPIFCKVLKTSVYRGLRFMPGVFYEDIPYLYQMAALHSANEVQVNAKLYYYRKFDGSIMHQRLRLKHLQSYKAIITATVNHCLSAGCLDLLKVFATTRLPDMLKSQLAAVRRASKEEREEMRRLFVEELRFLFAHHLIPWRKHKLRRYLKYRWLVFCYATPTHEVRT